MAKRPIRRLQVVDKRPLSTNMVRVTLGGDDLADFPPGSEGDYVKLMLPRDPGFDVAAAELQSLERSDFVMRSYTVRRLDVAARRLVLDFLVQGHAGAASSWVQAAQVGDSVLVTGPGPVKSLDASADAVFVAGDMSALPAIAAQLERLPPDARGVAVVEVLAEDDKQPLSSPEGVAVRWLVTPDAHGSRLPEAVREEPWPPGRVCLWAACEFGTMKRLRSYFFDEREADRASSYLSSYWKIDATDEQHKAAKRTEAFG
ncbi:MAG: siderophore-interacting protein [Myxococcales bacterium]|nr:siderophore-interacting protein [Myxococcales bacterium]